MIEQIREIRSRLRLAMNGVVATSMRSKGVAYKMNFGVSLPDLRAMATEYVRDLQLAEALWKEDTRELKILATLLCPPDTFPKESACRWISDVRHQEIAEQLCANLLENLPYSEQLFLSYCNKKEGYEQVIAFLLVARICSKGYELNEEAVRVFIDTGCSVLNRGISREQRAILLAFKRFGRQSVANAGLVMAAVSEYEESDNPEYKEFFKDLSFEFEYYG